MSNFSIERGTFGNVGGGFDSARLRESKNDIGVQETGAGSEAGGTKTFGEFVKELVQDANTGAIQADGKMQEVAAGRSKDLHGAVLAMEKADVQFRLMTQVRNKVIEAYREIMRMQV